MYSMALVLPLSDSVFALFILFNVQFVISH